VGLRGRGPPRAPDGAGPPLAHQPGPAARRPESGRQARRPDGLVARTRPDAHTRPFAPLLGEVPASAIEPAGTPRRLAGDQAGRSDRRAERLEATPPQAGRSRGGEGAGGQDAGPASPNDLLGGAALPVRHLVGRGLTAAPPGLILPPGGIRDDQRGDEGQGPRSAQTDRGAGAGSPADDRWRGILRRHPAPDLGGAGRARAGREAPAGPAHRVVRDRRHSHGLEERAPAEDRRAARRVRAVPGQVMTTQVAPVRGMHCAACVGRVERALTGLAGVERASVNLASEQATVSYDPEQTSFDALQAAVAAAGYELVRPPPDAAPGAALD